MHITQTILQEISFQITTGNPWWGLVVANEYLPPDSGLYKALYQRAMLRLGRGAAHLPLAHKLRRGYRANMLPAELRASVGPRIIPIRRVLTTRTGTRVSARATQRRHSTPRLTNRRHHSRTLALTKMGPEASATRPAVQALRLTIA